MESDLSPSERRKLYQVRKENLNRWYEEKLSEHIVFR